MGKREEIKDLKRNAFARAYVANGGNATEAALTIQPQLTTESAGVIGCNLLSDVKTVSAIDALWGETRTNYQRLLDKCVALAQTWADSNNPKLQADAMKWTKDISSIFAPENKTPRTATQINNYRLPKR